MTNNSENEIVDFAWIELTNRCNLECRHCYAESGPYTGDKDLLEEEDYSQLLSDLAAAGCRKVQFIGGEPTLNRSLPDLIETAVQLQFEFIEIYSNLYSINEHLISLFRKYDVNLATSFYSHIPDIHDKITTRPGSFGRTVINIQRVIAAGLHLRAGVILMESNEDHWEETQDYLKKLGIEQIGFDRAREFGRFDTKNDCDMQNLCGDCAGKIVSIAPDGPVSPCNMSRKWVAGSVLNEPILDILESGKMRHIRERISKSVGTNKSDETACGPSCPPYGFCCPNTEGFQPCVPFACTPNRIEREIALVEE